MITIEEQKIIIRNGLDKISKENGINIEKEELDYYVEHLEILTNPITRIFLGIFFDKYISASYISMMTRREYTEAIILMRKILLEKHNLKIFPYILSGNRLSDYSPHVKTSITILDGFIEQIADTKFTFVDYDNPNRLGIMIDIEPSLLRDEIMIFISSIRWIN